MKKVILGIALLSQFGYGMDLPNSSSERQEWQSNQLVSVGNTEETTVAQLPVNDLQDMIRNSVRESVSAVMGDQLNVNTREFQVALNVVSLRLRDAFQGQMNMQAVNFRTILDRKDEEHQQEMDAKDAQLEEVKKTNTLRGLLLKININDKTPISERAVNIQQLKILERHDKTEAIYKRCLPFSELLGRTDLGVTATQRDLDAVGSYLKNTMLSDTAKTVGKLAGNNRPTATISSPVFAISSHSGPVIVEHSVISVGSFSITVNEYIRQLIVYDEASSVPFPAEEFNRLIDQVNRFFTEGLQDSH